MNAETNLRSKTNKSALTTAEILSLMNMQSAVTVKNSGI